MNLRQPLTISLVLLAAMAAMSVWGWAVLPDTARLVSHWSLDGTPDGSMSKPLGLLLLPAIGLAMVLIMILVPRIEPRRDNLISSRKAFFVFWIGGLGVLAFSHAMIVLAATGTALDVPGTLIVLIALMIAVGGNYLGKVRSNFFLGIRTPWTLSSELSWEKSHRLLGRLFVLSALATLVARFAVGTREAFLVFAATVAASALLAIVGSYVYWRQDPERHTA